MTISDTIKEESSFLVIWNLIRRYKKQFFALSIILLIEGAIAALSIIAIVPLTDYLLDPSLHNISRVTVALLPIFSNLGVTPSFWLFGALFVGLNFSRGLFEVVLRYAVLRIKYAVVRGLFADALSSFFRARWTFFSEVHQGRLLNSLSRELNTIGDAVDGIASLIARSIQVWFYLAVPFWLNAKMTVMALGLLAIFGAPFIMLRRTSARMGRANVETAGQLLGVLSEVIGSAKLIKAFFKQKEALGRYLRAYDNHVHATLLSQTLITGVEKLFQPLALLAAVIAMGFALQSKAQVSELAAVMWSLLASFPIFATLVRGNVFVGNFMPSYNVLQSLKKDAEHLREIEGSKSFSHLSQGIELRNVNYAYPGRKITIQDLSLNVPVKKTIAIIGGSGAGKSTVADLILGLIIPESGSVLVDGVPLQDWNIGSFRERIGYVPQEPILFHASIRDNLQWFTHDACEAALWKALNQANADKFIKELPKGINTIVGDRGVRLSGGQRQRIALARALLCKPELLILDEATSSLDSESEHLIQKAIERTARDTTILIIAHRLSTIAHADWIYVLDHGRVVEEGTFDFLKSKKGGVMSKMLLIQSGAGRKSALSTKEF